VIWFVDKFYTFRRKIIVLSFKAYLDKAVDI